MIIHETVKRLRGINHPIFKDKVAGASDYFSAKVGNALRAPYIYVIDGTQAQAGGLIPNEYQAKQLDWRHTFIVSAIAKQPCGPDDMTGKGATDLIYPIRCVIFDALLGWSPHESLSPIIPVNIILGAGTSRSANDGLAEEHIEIMFTFTALEKIAIKRQLDPNAQVGQLEKFGMVMNGLSTIIDTCAKVPHCEYQTITSDTCGDN